MDIKEFQTLLAGLCKTGKEQGNTLTAEQIREKLSASDFVEEQYTKVYQYLKVQGIEVEGADLPKEEKTAEKADAPKNQIPLSPQEKAYYDGYLASMPAFELSEHEKSELFRALAMEDQSAKERLVSYYLRFTATLARMYYTPAILLQDLIGESNLCLFELLSQKDPKHKDDRWLKKELARGMEAVIEAQTRQKLADDSLVSKVEKLESAIRELTDDDEKEIKFSVEEISIFLDMPVETIRDVLKLVGE